MPVPGGEQVVKEQPERLLPGDETTAADQHQPGGPPVLPAAHHPGRGGYWSIAPSG